MLPLHRLRRATLAVATALAAWGALAPSAAAAPSTAQEERAGAAIYAQVQQGKRACKNLKAVDFERIGEFVMGRMAGSTAAHESMNALLSSTTGARGEEQMHVFMGRRFTGCGGGPVPGNFGAMMGMMGAAGGSYSGTSQGSRGGANQGSMMGGPNGVNGVSSATRVDSNDGSDDDDDGTGAPMIVMMLGLLALAGIALWLLRPGHRPAGGGGRALEVLARRYASGEIDTDEYERRRRALGDTA